MGRKGGLLLMAKYQRLTGKWIRRTGIAKKKFATFLIKIESGKKHW
jgi:hypothetical protein